MSLRECVFERNPAASRARASGVEGEGTRGTCGGRGPDAPPRSASHHPHHMRHHGGTPRDTTHRDRHLDARVRWCAPGVATHQMGDWTSRPTFGGGRQCLIESSISKFHDLMLTSRQEYCLYSSVVKHPLRKRMVVGSIPTAPIFSQLSWRGLTSSLSPPLNPHRRDGLVVTRAVH